MNKLFYLFALIAVSLIHAQGGGGGGVSKIIAGSNVTISPTSGTGIVTINATGGGGGAGVTSVGVSVPSVLSVSGSPVTSAGTIAIGYSGSALPIANGGTAATTPANALVSLGAFGYNHDAYILVITTSSAVTNGNNLLAAYAAAILLTPNGNPIATKNRACVIVPPGNYDLGVQQLQLNTQFVDLSGWSANAGDVVITSERTNPDEGTIFLSVDDVSIANLTLAVSGTGPGNQDQDDPAAYFSDNQHSQITISNVVFSVSSGNNPAMRLSSQYNETFIYCTCLNDFAFGSGPLGGGSFEGTAINCTGGNYAFGGFGQTVGILLNCTGSLGAFGGEGGTCGGTLTNCTAQSDSFGGQAGSFIGNAINCTGGDDSFGAEGAFSGTALNCIGVGNSFAGNGGTFSGKAVNCSSTTNGFGAGGVFSGQAINCFGGSGSFIPNTFSSRPLIQGCQLSSGVFSTDSSLRIVGSIDGNNVLQNFPQPVQGVGSGTAYNLTATPAGITFGTSNPSFTLNLAGNYLLLGTVVLEFNGATFASSQTVTLTIHRTNNTPGDIPNATVSLITGIVTTATSTLAVVQIPATPYSTTTAGDSLIIYGSVSVVPSAGHLQAVAPGTTILAVPL